MSDRIAVVNHGRIMQLATPRDLYERPANRFVADFIGESTFLPVARRGDKVQLGEMPLKTDNSVPDAAELLLMVRPERIRLLTDAPDDDMNVLSGTATEVVYQGDSFVLYARLPGGEQIALRGAVRSGTVQALPAVGDAVTLGLAASDTVVIDGAET